MPGNGALLLLVFAAVVVVVLLILLQLTRVGYLVRSSIPDRPRRRMFLASVAFLCTFIGTRILVSLIVHDVGPFGWVMVRGRHIHHLVWGILILLGVGYGWLLDLGRSHSPVSIFLSRLMSVSYGVGAALTLDEFSIWLNLEPNDYWSSAGRLSIDAVILFGAVLCMGAWGAPFFRAMGRLWDKRAIVGRGLTFPIRRVKSLRQNRAHRSKRRSVR